MMARLVEAAVVVVVVGMLAALVRHSPLGEVGIVRGSLVIRPHGIHRLLAFQMQPVSIPLERIRAIRVGVPRRGIPTGWRARGTRIPGVACEGSFRARGFRSFWFVGHASRVAVVEANGAPYDRLVLELDDETAAALSAAVACRRDT